MDTENINPEFAVILAALARNGGEATRNKLTRSIAKYNRGEGSDAIQPILDEMVALQILSVRTTKGGNHKLVDTYCVNAGHDANGNDNSNANNSNGNNSNADNLHKAVKTKPRNSNAVVNRSSNSNARNGNSAIHLKIDADESAIRISIPAGTEIVIEGWREFIGLLAPVINAINGNTEPPITESVDSDRPTIDDTEITFDEKPSGPAPSGPKMSCVAVDDNIPFDLPPGFDEASVPPDAPFPSLRFESNGCPF